MCCGASGGAVVFELSHPLGPVSGLDAAGDGPGAGRVEEPVPFQSPQFLHAHLAGRAIPEYGVRMSRMPIHGVRPHSKPGVIEDIHGIRVVRRVVIGKGVGEISRVGSIRSAIQHNRDGRRTLRKRTPQTGHPAFGALNLADDEDLRVADVSVDRIAAAEGHGGRYRGGGPGFRRGSQPSHGRVGLHRGSAGRWAQQQVVRINGVLQQGQVQGFRAYYAQVEAPVVVRGVCAYDDAELPQV